MLEKDLWAKMKASLNLDWMERVEHKNSPGWPDVHFAHKKPAVNGWIELKVARSLPTAMPYRPAQAPWLYNYWQAGGLCFTILYCEKDGQLRLWKGCDSYDLEKENGPKNIRPVVNIRMDKDGWQVIKERLLSFA